LSKSPEERLLFIYGLLSDAQSEGADLHLVQAIWELIDILQEQGVFKEHEKVAL
jgi:hypothetical protein